MYFRFGSGVCLVVVISMLGIAIEKENLDLRRELSRQHFRMDVLQDEHARLRLQTQQLAGVERLFETVGPENSIQTERPSPGPNPVSSHPGHVNQSDGGADPESEVGTRRIPLLFWQRSLRDPRLDEK